MINLIAAVLCLIITAMLAILGVDWITLGYGLNPWIAFPLSFVFGVIAILNANIWVQTSYYDWRTREMQRKIKWLRHL